MLGTPQKPTLARLSEVCCEQLPKTPPLDFLRFILPVHPNIGLKEAPASRLVPEDLPSLQGKHAFVLVLGAADWLETLASVRFSLAKDGQMFLRAVVFSKQNYYLPAVRNKHEWRLCTMAGVKHCSDWATLVLAAAELGVWPYWLVYEQKRRPQPENALPPELKKTLLLVTQAKVLDKKYLPHFQLRNVLVARIRQGKPLLKQNSQRPPAPISEPLESPRPVAVPTEARQEVQRPPQPAETQGVVPKPQGPSPSNALPVLFPLIPDPVEPRHLVPKPVLVQSASIPKPVQQEPASEILKPLPEIAADSEMQSLEASDRIFVKGTSESPPANGSVSNLDEEWTCEFCSFRNLPRQFTCEMCSAMNQELKDKLQGLQ